MPNNMPDSRAINEALRRATEFHNRAARAAQEQPHAASGDPPAKEPPAQPQTAAPPAPAPVQAAAPQAQALTLETLLQDKERTLLLALLVLLAGEETGADLLFALFYLLI